MNLLPLITLFTRFGECHVTEDQPSTSYYVTYYTNWPGTIDRGRKTPINDNNQRCIDRAVNDKVLIGSNYIEVLTICLRFVHMLS